MNPIFRIAAALAIGGVAYLMYPTSAPQPAPGARADVPEVAALYSGPSFALPSAAHYPPLPQTAVRAPVFTVDGNGELMLDASTAIRLDLLLAELPERAQARELQHIEERAKEGLPDDAARKAVRILNDYHAYRRAESELESELESQPGSKGSASAQARLDKLVALRREHLGPQVADALFSAAEAQARFGIAATYIEADPTLTRQQKAQRIDALRQSLPADAASAEHDGTHAARAVEDRVAALRQQGASESDVRLLREREIGPEGAQAITEMEAQQLAWERRYQAFLLQKNAVLSATGNDQQKQQMIEALLRQHYSEEEIAAARAYDAGGTRQ